MKKKFTKILGVGLTLALLFSLLLTAAPVSALGVPSVTVTPTTISAVDADYAIRFELDKQLTGGGTNVTGFNYELVDIDEDSFVLTATVAGQATVVEGDGTVTVAMSGGGSSAYAAGTHTITFAAANETATVTGLTGDATTSVCNGTWTAGTATATALVGVGAAADTITIVFQSDTAVTTDPTVTMVAGPGWRNGVWLDAVTAPALTSTEIAGTVDTRTVVITLPTAHRIGEGAEVRLSFTAGLTNPSASGNYTLTVETSKETTAVTSAAYAITVPTIPGLPGVASVYNPAGVLMAQKNKLDEAITAAGVDYTIYVGPGTYAGGIDISHEGLTFVSTAGAATTIIEGTITVSALEVTVDGFTVEVTSGPAIWVKGAGTDAIVQNNIITAEDGWPDGILLNATGATISSNELSINTTMMVMGATDCTLSDNTFGAGINIDGSTGITITDNDLTGAEFIGIRLGGSDCTDILIEGNTISETTLAGSLDGGIGFPDNTGIFTNLQIIGNDITDNEGVGIVIPAGVTLTDSVIKFNTITGNDADGDGYGIETDVTEANAVDATFNWWGTAVADDVAAMVNDIGAGATAYEPFLTGVAEAVLSASDAATGTSLDASTTVGVKVTVANADTTVATGTVPTIVVAKYTANPQEDIGGAIAFFDVYVAGVTPVTDEVATATIKFYAGDANTDVYLWSAATETWGAVTPVDFSAYGGYVYVTVETDMLGGTPFALVGGAAAALEAPVIAAPETGADDVSLTPIFAWGVVAGADGYNFQLADNANFVTPMVKLDGDLGRLVVTAYAYVGELPYSTAYYWRVQAVSGTVAAGDLGESPWSTGVFITMDEPAEELPPVVVQEQPPVIIEPIVEVITPAATEITPAWIYVIIGVGAVLVIALLVLIVRTRRVA